MPQHKRLSLILCAALALVASGCSTTVRPTPVPAFFPPPPAAPRIQFLTSFSGLKDIDEQSAFNRFVVGERQDIKVDKPYGIAVYDAKIYVCDTNSTVAVFDLRRKTFGPLSGAVGQGTLRQPVNISIDADGNKYVSDPGRRQVVVFDRTDQYLRAYGMEGDWRPVDAAVLEDRLYVADIDKGLIRIFDKQSGELIKSIGDQGEPSQRLDRPTNLAFDHDGDLYVSDVGRFQVVKFDRDGHFKSTIGKIGDNLGHFARPKGIAFDRDNRLFAVDASFNNVQIFNRDGRLLLFFGETGDKPGNLRLPAKVTIDYDSLEYFRDYLQPGFEPEYLIFVTSQFGERRINVFAFGKQQGVRYPTDAELRREIEERAKKEESH